MAFKRRRTTHTHNLRCAALQTRFRKDHQKKSKSNAMASEHHPLQVKNAHFDHNAWPGPPRWVGTREKEVYEQEDLRETRLHDDDVSRCC